MVIMMMTKDLIDNHAQIMIDAQNLFEIGAVCDSMGKSESFDRYFHEKYELDTEIDEWFGIKTEVLTDEQGTIYAEYTHKVARELFSLQHNR
jgi:hypothetical protein